jgi:hypothetical protein
LANPRNTFSKHILNTEVDETEPATLPKSPTAVPTAPTPPRKPEEPRAQNIKEPIPAPESKTRPDYRKTRASKEGKKYINILIDEELQSELKPRMVTRKLTWESLVEGLLQRWLEENPGYKP